MSKPIAREPSIPRAEPRVCRAEPTVCRAEPRVASAEPAVVRARPAAAAEEAALLGAPVLLGVRGKPTASSSSSVLVRDLVSAGRGKGDERVITEGAIVVVLELGGAPGRGVAVAQVAVVPGALLLAPRSRGAPARALLLLLARTALLLLPLRSGAGRRQQH